MRSTPGRALTVAAASGPSPATASMSPFSTAAAAAASSSKKLSSMRSMNGVRPGDEGDGTGVARESGEAVISGVRGLDRRQELLRRDEDGLRLVQLGQAVRAAADGRLANSLVAMSAYGVSPRRWAGSSGWVVAARKPPTGVVRRNVTVLSSSAAVSTSAQDRSGRPTRRGP